MYKINICVYGFRLTVSSIDSMSYGFTHCLRFKWEQLFRALKRLVPLDKDFNVCSATNILSALRLKTLFI